MSRFERWSEYMLRILKIFIIRSSSSSTGKYSTATISVTNSFLKEFGSVGVSLAEGSCGGFSCDNVTLETNSPSVVENWLRYQMGRGETEKAWGRTGLGVQVIADMHAIRQEMAGEAAQKAFGDQESEHVQQAHIALVRLYAGYLKRWFVANGG